MTGDEVLALAILAVLARDLAKILAADRAAARRARERSGQS